MNVAALTDFVRQCRALGLVVGLAGALEAPDVPRLLVTGADVLGFRGALCAKGDRRAALNLAATALIRDLIPQQRDVEPVSYADGALLGYGFIEPPAASDIDYVFLHDYVVPTEIGAYASELGRTQRVRFNVDAEVSRVTVLDDMRSVFSYDVIVDAIKVILGGGGHIVLVETIAERLAESLLLHERVRAVTVQVEKLDIIAAIVGVKIRRERAHEQTRRPLIAALGAADARKEPH
jgi:dihydroneopterin aldolase